MKTLAEAFSGRSRAYDEALSAPDGLALAKALARNVLGTAEPAHGLASYVRESEVELTIQDLNGLLREGPRFAEAQTCPEGGRP
jgi:cytochrome b pre-mRNA-processing protein 3